MRVSSAAFLKASTGKRLGFGDPAAKEIMRVSAIIRNISLKKEGGTSSMRFENS